MEFGLIVFPHPEHVVKEATFAEEQGFSYVGFADCPVSGGDVYACMALAAVATRKITLVTHIATAPMRPAPVTVQAIATVNALAPGRVILGFGTGSFTRSLMGLPPMKIRDFRTQLVGIRTLLSGSAALYETEGLQRKIRFYNRDRGFIRLEPRIPLYIAASAPKVAMLAGEFGDGLMTAPNTSPEQLASLLEQMTQGTRKAGRELGSIPCMTEGPICVLHSGESLASERVIAATALWVMITLKAYANSRVAPDAVPEPLRSAYLDFLAHINRITGAAEEQYLAIWEGVLTFRPEERQFVTPGAIQATTPLVGTLEEVVERLRALKQTGVTHFTVWLPETEIDGYLRDLRQVIDRL